MNLESFSQCLNYIQSVTPKGDVSAKVTPIAGTLIGTIFGFILNQFTTKLKEGKAKKNKLTCCDEDVHRLKAITQHTTDELINLLVKIKNQEQLVDHNLPSKLNAFYLSEHFIELAHNFSVNQRYWTHLLIENLDEMNGYLDTLANEPLGKPFELSKVIIQSIDLATRMHLLCRSIQEDHSRTDMTTSEVLFVFGLWPEAVAAYDVITDNISAGDRELHLNKRF